MKLLWIAPYPYFVSNKPQHPAPWVQMLAYRLKEEAGIELTILSMTASATSEIEEVEKDGIKFIFIKKINSIFTNEFTLFQISIRKLRSYLKKNYTKYDLIHLHGSEHQYHTSAKGLDIPKVLSIQGILTEYAKVVPNKLTVKYLTLKLGGIYETLDLKTVKNFSCRTHWDSGYVKKHCPDSKIFNIWEMIRPSFFTDHFSLKKDKLLFLGGTQQIKGFKEMLQAFDKIRAKANVKLMMAGNVNTEEVKNTIETYKLKNISDDDIEIKGFLDEQGIIDVYNSAFCFVHPSYIDNSPNSVCEAQLSGLPVVASDVGGVSSLITDKETGILTDLNIDNIANSVLELLDDDSLRDKISEQSRELARKRHDPDEILKQNVEMYKSIIS
ncbi:MAG: hypothetical protein CMO01_31420 [Thalassobius sp.]|nr:hypothetical protein [Thalassovita sp.]